MIAQGCSFAQYERPIIPQYESPILLLIHLGISTVATENQVSGRLHPVATRIRCSAELSRQSSLHASQDSTTISETCQSPATVEPQPVTRLIRPSLQRRRQSTSGKACNPKNTNQAKKVSRGKIQSICIVSAKIFLHLLVISRLRCKCRPEV